ncbi:MAG: hypothetical protein WAV40_02595 [Microgenomates group bacterium]
MPYPKLWTTAKLTKLKSLYNSGLSMKEVGKYFDKSVNSIAKIMVREKIGRRLASQTRSAHFLKSPLSFTPKTKLSTKEIKLKIAGLMLYWGEGAKRNANRIDFANSDPEMILVFLSFLRKIYQVDETKFRIYLYSYHSLPTSELIAYWSNLTKIPTTQFSKPYIRAKSELKHDKMQHGLIHIRYSDIRLLKLVMDEIEQFAKNC